MSNMISDKSAEFNALVFRNRAVFGLSLLLVALVLTALASKDLSFAQVLAAARF